MITKSKLILILFSNLLYGSNAILDGLHPTPPMGWTSWNTFFTHFNEEKMIGQVNALKNLGLDKLGYTYLTIDDQWHLPDRDSETGKYLLK